MVISFAIAIADANAQSIGLERLRLQIQQAIPPARGDVGVAIKHLETGQEVLLNADDAYPLASAVKLPILVELHTQVKAGKVSWDEMYPLKPNDQHVGSGDIPVYFDLPGVSMSIRNVANMMMMISDNSATDIVLNRIGGPAPVQARMRELGFNGIRVDRTIQELVLDWGEQDTNRLKGMTLKEMRPFMRPGPSDEAGRLARYNRVTTDARDQATPRDMNRLLEMLWQGKIVDSEASSSILELMKRCRTGAGRIRGLLPPSTAVAHKTGSLGGTVDDIGIIYLPQNAGHLAISIMSKRTLADSPVVEHVVAEIARYAYDYFLFTAPPVAAGQ
jgi:beta-lactamase class A